MGIDYGKKRVGIALSDPDRHFAMPESVIPNDDHLLENIQKIIKEREVIAIVLGESKDFSGEANKIQAEIAQFKKNLEIVSGLSVFYEPELLTSREATHIQGEGAMLDASAAALILKGYLDRQQMNEDKIDSI
jgi:putative holliday junction resolvase